MFQQPPHVNTSYLLNRCFAHLEAVSLSWTYLERYSKTWIVKPNQSTCVINNINHIRLIIDKWDWFTFNDCALSHSCHYNILIYFHHQPFFFLNTHGQEFIDWPFVFMCVVRNYEQFKWRWKSDQNIMHKKNFRHVNLKSL